MDTVLRYLLGVDPQSLEAGTDWTIRLNARPEGWICAMLLVGAFVFSGFIYRRERHDASTPMRVFLAILRGLLIVIALIILFEPVIAVEHLERRRGVIAVLIDESRSMSIRDRLRRDEQVDRLRKALGSAFKMKNDKGEEVTSTRLSREDLEKLARIDIANWLVVDEELDLLKRLGKKGRLKLYHFSSRIWPRRGEPGEVVPGEALPEGNVTALGRCLRMAINDLKGLPICAVIILSDGRSNAGESPDSAAAYAKTKGIPVFTVAIGDPEEPKDIEISGVEAPEVVSARDYVNIEAFVSSKGYPGYKVKVSLLDGEKEVVSEDMVLQRDGGKQMARLRFKPEKPGEFNYTLRVSALPDELLEENNSERVRMRIIEEKTKVLYLEGAPRWEYRYLKNALIRDTAVEAACLLWRDEKGFFREGSVMTESFPDDIQGLLKFDVIVLGEVPPDTFTDEQLKLLKTFVSDHAGGLMVVSGPRYAPAAYSGNPVGEMLPIVFDGSVRSDGMGALADGFRLELSEAGKVHEVCRLNPAGGQANMEVWQSLPPLFWCFPAKRAKAAATVLATHPVERGDDEKKLPVIATQFYGSGRTMFIGSDSLWRWRWGVGERFFYRFYSQAIQYLAYGKLYGAQKRFSLSFDSAEVAMGEKVRMRARVLDRDFKAAAYESVDVIVEAEGVEPRKVELKAIPGSPGLYEGEFLPPAQGSFVVKADVPGEGSTQVGSFEVRMPRREFADPRTDEAALRNLSAGAADGGAFLAIDELGGLPEKVKSRDEEIYTESQIVLWDTWRMLVLFAVLITAEWLLRRWCRML